MECKLVSAPRHFERSMQISGTPLSSCFTRRFKGRSQLAVPSILFLDQHFLHTVQPLPSSSSVIYPLSHVLQIAERFYQTPRLASLPEELRNSWVLSLPGSYPVHRYCKPFRHLLAFLPFPVSAGYRSDLLQSISLWDEEGFSSC